jgi:tRNA(Ile)-lysidine synthase
MTPPDEELVDRFRRDLAGLGGAEQGRLGIALSGGPDSLALLLLAAAAAPGAVSAATVDHGLRPESASEAELAARACAALDVPHRTLPVEVEQGASVQASARRARYAALERWAREEGIAILLTAHHADDQAETLLMRLLRGSGVAGLAGVRARLLLPGGALLCRPLLGWRRRELAAIVHASGLDPVDDPSNGDDAYDRVRIRRALAQTPWIDAAALARSAAALADAEEALEVAADRLMEERAAAAERAVTLDPAGVPTELLRRLCARCLARAAPEARPRGEQVGALIAKLQAGRTATLAGVKCSGGAVWRFEPAPPRRS